MKFALIKKLDMIGIKKFLIDLTRIAIIFTNNAKMTNSASYIIIFIFGSCIGSFLNVCIYRIPLSSSIVKPASMCPKCKSPIHFYDNIPILSYLILLGKCRQCKEKISLKYPFVELLSGFMACCCFYKFGYSWQSAIYFGLITILIVVAFIDIEHRIIPDIISLPAIPAGLISSFILPSINFSQALIGMTFGGAILYFVAWSYQALTGKEGMGGGDIKLLAMIGAFIGWKGVLFTVFIASATGSLVGIFFMLLMKKNMKYALPFGPFLSIGAIVYIYIGPEFVKWYYPSICFNLNLYSPSKIVFNYLFFLT